MSGMSERCLCAKVLAVWSLVLCRCGPIARRTSAVETQDCDINISEPVPVEYDSTRKLVG